MNPTDYAYDRNEIEKRMTMNKDAKNKGCVGYGELRTIELFKPFLPDIKQTKQKHSMDLFSARFRARFEIKCQVYNHSSIDPKFLRDMNEFPNERAYVYINLAKSAHPFNHIEHNVFIIDGYNLTMNGVLMIASSIIQYSQRREFITIPINEFYRRNYEEKRMKSQLDVINNNVLKLCRKFNIDKDEISINSNETIAISDANVINEIDKDEISLDSNDIIVASDDNNINEMDKNEASIDDEELNISVQENDKSSSQKESIEETSDNQHIMTFNDACEVAWKKYGKQIETSAVYKTEFDKYVSDVLKANGIKLIKGQSKSNLIIEFVESKGFRKSKFQKPKVKDPETGKMVDNLVEIAEATKRGEITSGVVYSFAKERTECYKLNRNGNNTANNFEKELLKLNIPSIKPATDVEFESISKPKRTDKALDALGSPERTISIYKAFYEKYHMKPGTTYVYKTTSGELHNIGEHFSVLKTHENLKEFFDTQVFHESIEESCEKSCDLKLIFAFNRIKRAINEAIRTKTKFDQYTMNIFNGTNSSNTTLYWILRQVKYYKSSPTKLSIYINEHSDEINQIMSEENNYRIIIDEQLLIRSTGSAEKCWSIEKV